MEEALDRGHKLLQQLDKLLEVKQLVCNWSLEPQNAELKGFSMVSTRCAVHTLS